MLSIIPAEDYLAQAYGSIKVHHINSNVWSILIQHEAHKTFGVNFTAQMCAEHAHYPSFVGSGGQEMLLINQEDMLIFVKHQLEKERGGPCFLSRYVFLVRDVPLQRRNRDADRVSRRRICLDTEVVRL